MRLNFGREGFIFFSFYRFQKIYPDNTIIEFPVILNQHKRKQKKRFPVKLIRFGKPRDFLDYLLFFNHKHMITNNFIINELKNIQINIYIQDKKMNPHLNYQTFISSEYS